MALDIIFRETFSARPTRYFKRRKYQRLHSSAPQRRKLPVITLGGQDPDHQRRWKLKSAARKLKLKSFISPITLLVKFREAYINMMISWAKKMGMGRLNFRKRNKHAQATMTVAGQQVDPRLVMEIYNKMMAHKDHQSHQTAAAQLLKI